MPTTAPLLLAFLAACLVQLAGGLLLIWPRSSGFAVVPVGMLLSAPFWWGFDLPLAWLNAALALPLLAAAWPCTGKSHVIRARAADPQPATIGKTGAKKNRLSRNRLRTKKKIGAAARSGTPAFRVK